MRSNTTLNATAPVSTHKETAASFTVVSTGAALGADIIGLDLSQPLNSATVQALQAAWNLHLVLRFRCQQKLSVQDHIRFSSYFGVLDKRPIASQAWHADTDALPQEIVVISNVVQDGKPVGGLGDGESVWHADMTYQPVPPKAALLLALEIPAEGGNTYFANLYQAYDTLPEDIRQRIEGLECVHDASRNSAGELRLGFADSADPRQTVGAVHPLVRVNPATGKKACIWGAAVMLISKA